MADNQNRQLNTDQIRDLLSPYLDDEVTQEERALVEQALAASVELQRELETLRRTVALVAALPPVAAPRPFTLTEADVKGAPPASKGFFGWSIWVKSVAGLAAALLCVAAAAGVFLTMQGGGASSQQAAEVANAPAVSPTEGQAAARQEAASAESAASEEPAPAELVTEEALGQAAAPPTPTTLATPTAALTESAADEVAEPAAPAGEEMTTNSEAYRDDQEMQSQQAPAAGVIEPTTLPRPEATSSPTPETPMLAAPAEEPAQEEATAAEADVNQKAAESSPALTEEAAAAGAAEVATENAQAPEQPPAEATELELVLPTASPTATLSPEPDTPAVALLTPTVPVTLTSTLVPTVVPESSPPSSMSWWFGAGIAVVGLVIMAGLIIWLFGRRQNRAP